MSSSLAAVEPGNDFVIIKNSSAAGGDSVEGGGGNDTIGLVFSAKASINGGGGDDTLGKLKELGELRDSGVLTEEEFAAQKAKLLG